jgi:predicted transcriptional regulator
MDDLDKASQINLSPEQEAAIKMLTSGCSVRYTALILGLKQATISAWIARDPAFQSRQKETESCNTADESEEAEKLSNPVGE